MRRTISLAWLVAVLAACDHDDGTAAAQATFSAFQDALQRRDESACRSLLTGDSAQALTDMPWERIQRQQPLQVRGARRAGYTFRVEVVDPNANGSAGEFVVVREHGRLVVDLVASAGLTATVVEATGSKQELAPRALTPEDFDRIRQHELAQPAR